MIRIIKNKKIILAIFIFDIQRIIHDYKLNYYLLLKQFIVTLKISYNINKQKTKSSLKMHFVCTT